MIKKRYDLIVILITLASLFLSIYLNIFNYDQHHPVKMFVEANQFLNGLVPYEEIFISYGFLTTFIHSMSLIFFGKNVLSLFIITAIFYASTFLIYYLILTNIKIGKKFSCLFVFLIFLIHPNIILPWANYFAYLFLILGIFFLTKDKNRKNLLYTGFFWALASFSRQDYFFSIFMSLICVYLYEFFFNRNFSFIKNSEIKDLENYFTPTILFGFLTPIFIFILYLLSNNLFFFWKYITLDIPIYFIKSLSEPLNEFNNFNIFLSIISIFKNILSKLVSKDPRYIFFLIISLINIYFLIKFFNKKHKISLMYIICLSLFLFSTNVHFTEIFRLSTGVIVGGIATVFFLKKKLFFKYLLYVFVLLLIFTWHSGNQNFSYLRYKEYTSAPSNYNFSKINYFKNQVLPKSHSEFYDIFLDTINDLHSKFILNKNYNFSPLPILGLLSKTKNYQLESYYDITTATIYDKRNDIDLDYAYSNYNDMIIFNATNNDILEKELFYNFYIYKKLKYPFITGNYKYLFILIPKNVKTK